MTAMSLVLVRSTAATMRARALAVEQVKHRAKVARVRVVKVLRLLVAAAKAQLPALASALPARMRLREQVTLRELVTLREQVTPRGLTVRVPAAMAALA
jgi:hypothetical protein